MSFMSELKICEHFYVKDRPGPVMVDLHPTLACQLKCYFCISANPHIAGMEHDNFARSKQIDWLDLVRVIDELKNLGVRSIQLTGGGEPTLYPEFSKLLKELQPIKVGLMTNGVVLGEYAEEVVKYCDWVRVSLDAVGSEMFRQIKGVDYYQQVMDGIRKVGEVRGRWGNRPRFGVSYVLTNESIRGIPDVVSELQDCAIDYIQFKDVIERGRTFNQAFEERIQKGLVEAREIAGNREIFYTRHRDGAREGAEGAGHIPVCDATDYVAVIGADSEVYGCCHLEYQDFASYGNIKERSFEEVWMNRPRVNITESLCWNCRYTKTNAILAGLKSIEDGEFI